MKRKIWIGLAIVFGLFIVFEVYQFATTRSHSPEKTEKFSSGEKSISVTYCRPYKKDRLIFGEESKGALVPYGVYWRLGANDATEITFTSEVLFGGEKVLAGTYRMYAVPYENHWEISLNSELGKFGYFEPNYDLDVAKVKAPVEKISNTVEQFSINFEKESEDMVMMYFQWANTSASVSIQLI